MMTEGKDDSAQVLSEAETLELGSGLREAPDPSLRTLYQDISEDDLKPVSSNATVVYDHVASTLAYITVFSMFGCLLRVVLGEVGANAGVDGYLFPNFLGTAVIAIVVQHKHAILARHIPMYAGIATGFCGSLTTFSTWQQSAVDIVGKDRLVDVNATNTGDVEPGLLVYNWVAIQGIGLAVGILGFDFGGHMESFLPHRKLGRETRQEEVVVRLSLLALDRRDCFSLLLGITCVGSVVAWCILQPSELSFAVAWAPLGAIVRWSLAFLNKRSTQFPVGTLVANVLGGSLLTGAGVLHASFSWAGVSRSALRGFMHGFCGSLTTVSTWISELRTLPRTRAYLYGLTTVMIAQVVMISIQLFV